MNGEDVLDWAILELEMGDVGDRDDVGDNHMEMEESNDLDIDVANMNGEDQVEDRASLGLGMGDVGDLEDVGDNDVEMEESMDMDFDVNWNIRGRRSSRYGLRAGPEYFSGSSSNAIQGPVDPRQIGNGMGLDVADQLQVSNDLGSGHGKGVVDSGSHIGMSDIPSSSSAPAVSGVTEGLRLGGPGPLRRLRVGLVDPPNQLDRPEDGEVDDLILAFLRECDHVATGNEHAPNHFEIFNMMRLNERNYPNEIEFKMKVDALQACKELGGRCGPSSSVPQVSSAADTGSCDRDMQNKRQKVDSFSILISSGEDAESNDLPTQDVSRTDNVLVSSNSSDVVETQVDLTDDILFKVFSLLDPVDICRASVVCRQWRSAGSKEDLWRNFTFENKPITCQQFSDMCRRYPNVVSVKLSDVPHIHSLAVIAVSKLRNLEVLILNKGMLSNSFFQTMTECRNLKNLTINQANLGSGKFGLLAIHHDRLCVLNVVECWATSLSIRCPKLLTLSLKHTNPASVKLHTPLLRHLDISRSDNFFSDTAIRAAVISCPLLESLVITNSCADNDLLREMGLACGNLRFLDVSHCQNFSFEFVRLPMLTVLKLYCCDSITSVSIAALSHSDALESLEIGHCNMLTSLALDLPRLKSFQIIQCPKFVALTLGSYMLSSINVSGCPLKRVDITARALRKLDLQKQVALTTVKLLCDRLEEVNLNGCVALTDSICEVFSFGGGCPMLKSLILDNCQSLTRASFRTSSLINLSIAYCLAITSIMLNCPLLEQLSLDGCHKVKTASLSPVGLESLNLGTCPIIQKLQIEASKMTTLVLLGCGRLSETSIDCPQLKSLDASFCSQLKDDFLSETSSSIPLVETLLLTSGFCAASDGGISLQLLESLTYLDLSFTYLENIEQVFKSCVHLKVLKLQACKYLADWSLTPLYEEGALPDLYELDLSYCTFSQEAIEGVLSCTRLTHVSLSGCVNMRDLNWDFLGDLQVPDVPTTPSLSSDMVSTMDEDIQLPDQQEPTYMIQQLNCNGCPNIEKIVIPSTARCSNLYSVNFSLSAYLFEVDLACSNLFSLNLSNCGSLKILKLNCPRLSSLNLQSCNNISEEAVLEAISLCSMLETLDLRLCPKIYPTNSVRMREACPSLKRIWN